MSESADTSEIRASEQLNWVALAEYIRPRLAAELKDATSLSEPMVVEQFPGGHSNLTYLLRFGNLEFALRRPPLGPVPPKAHDMARECRILTAIHPVFPLAPKPYLLCEDPAVIGSTFYLMERRHGVVIRGQEPPELLDKPRLREQTPHCCRLGGVGTTGALAFRSDMTKVRYPGRA